MPVKLQYCVFRTNTKRKLVEVDRWSSAFDTHDEAISHIVELTNHIKDCDGYECSKDFLHDYDTDYYIVTRVDVV